jgi:hypothetical protein
MWARLKPRLPDRSPATRRPVRRLQRAAAVVFTDEDTRHQLQRLKELLDQQRVAVERLERAIGGD